MKPTKHILPTIAMLLCCLTASAIDFGHAGFYFSITSEEDLTVEVTEYDKEYFKENYVVNGMFSVTIPDIVSYNSKKYRVASIGEEIFSGCSQLSSVTIPEGVTEIGEFAFRYCENLGRITFPGSLTTIGDCAFYNCSSLISINIPKSVTSIGNSAFSGCTVLRYFTISENSKLASIGDYAFSGCTGLTSITIPNGVTEIGEFAFSGCTGLTSITIPNGVTEIGEFAFRYCSSLVRITLPEGVTSIGCNAFEGCSSLTSINIPNSVTSIGKTAFSGCSRLTSINIPESVTTIGDDAFYNCSALASINISEDSQLTSIGGSAFYNCSSFTSINIPESVTSIGESAFAWCSSLASITISENSQLNSIGNEAFYNCGSLRTVYISRIEDWCKIDFGDEYSNPTFYTHDLCLNGELVTELLITEGVTSIGDGAFSGCSSLASITIPASVTSIGDAAFSGCRSLTSITIPENSQLISIGNSAFGSCSSLTSITIPEGVTGIGAGAFGDCSSLTSIVISETSKLTSIGYRAFRGCSALTSITLPEGVTSIGNEAFYNCSSLDSIAIPEEVTSIGEGTFSGCSSLTSITISGNVNSIGNAVFSDCTSLKEVVFEDGIRTLTLGCNKYEYDNNLGEGLFYDCPLKIVYLGRSLSHEIGLRYGYSPFYKKSLESLTIGEKVTVVGNNVFNECTANSITSISQSPPTIYSSTFSSMQRYLPVYVPASSVSAYKTADYWSKFDKIQAISISHIALSESSITLTEGEVFELAVTISPKGAEETLISWSSNSPNIASVDNTGKVTAIAPGTTTITAQANEDSGVNASCEVTVEPFKGVTSLDQLNNETLYYVFLPKHSGGGTSWAVAEGDVTLKSSAQLGITPDSNDSRQHFAIISNDVGTRFLYHVTEKKFVCKNGELSSIPTDAIYFKDGAYAYTFVAYFDDSHYVNVEADGTLGVNERSTSDGGNSFQIFSVGIFDSTKTPIKTEIDGVVYIFMPEIREAEVFLCNSTGDVIIPSMISYNAEEYSVTSIGKSAFSGCSSLTSINIPESVTSIGESAFYKCSSLTSITLPESVTSIGKSAFSGCSSLTSITIPESVTTIGDEAFYNCSALASINISEDSQLISIGNSAFEYCRSLTAITIPEGVTSIEYQAFRSCIRLTSITIPENSQLTSIGSSAFQSCYGLTAITIPEGVTSIGDWAFSACSSLTSITLPENSQLTSIGNGAFYNCSALTSITLPEGVTSIGNEAFSGCSRLLNVTMQAFDPPLVYDETFPHYDIELYVPKESVKAYKSADYWNMFTSIQTIIVKPTTGKNYRLKNVSTGLYLQVSGNNTNMTLQNKTAGIELAQVFQLEDAGDGKYYIKAADIENNYYAHASGWNFNATNNSANKTPFTIALVEGETEVYTLYQSVSSHIGNAGTDASGAGSPIYCDKRADQNGKWVFEALTRKENAEYVNAFTAVAKEQLDVTIARAEAVLATRSALLSAEEVAGIDSAVQTAKEDKDALTEVGALKALSDAIDAVVDDAIYVQSLDALSNGVCYVVATENRGAWYAQDKRLNSTTKIGVGVDITDVQQQFAFVQSPTTGDYYLYSVGEEKFVKKEGSYTALAADPEQTISFLEGTRSAQFPWVIAFNGENGQKQIAVSNNYDYGIITFYNDLGDGGNTVRFEKVATFNASAVIDAIRKYENDDVSSIANSQSTIHEAQFICDLHGRRVAHPTKGGIYIVNGRKVVIK